MAGELTPERKVLRDGAMAETRSDLEELLAEARGRLALHRGRDDVIADLVQDLIDQPAWDRLCLASVLGMAVVDLAAMEASDARQ